MSHRVKLSRVGYAAYFMGGLFGIAAISQAKVQVFSRAGTIQEAEKTNRYLHRKVDHARRGTIFTADDKQVAKDDDTYAFSLDYTRIPHSDAFFMDLGRAGGIAPSELSELATPDAKIESWKQRITSEQARAIKEVQAKWRADGVSLEATGARVYPDGTCVAGLTGMLREGKPVNGLELSRQAALAGKDGVTVGLMDRSGSFLPMRMEGQGLPRRDGEDLVLTIDSSLQAAAAGAIKEAVESNGADTGVAIVTDPATGDILAMANWPTFDPNNSGLSAMLGARTSDVDAAYMSRLEPGSMFKILTLAKALDENKVSMTDTVQCEGVLAVGNGKSHISCDSHHGNRAHGIVDAEKAIALSCNVSAAKWALKVGRDDFIDYIRQLGLLERPKIGLPSEQRGDINMDEPAQQLQLATLGFGQSITATPVGLANAFAMLANNGMRMKPRLIAKIGRRVNPVKESGRVVRADVAQKVMRCMEAVIDSEHGTGASLRIPGYRLAGKTGTAQKIDPATHRVAHGAYCSNFVGVVPAQQPKALILVMVDHPTRKAYYGAAVAGPVFKRLAQAVINRYHIMPTESVVETQQKAVAKK